MRIPALMTGFSIALSASMGAGIQFPETDPARKGARQISFGLLPTPAGDGSVRSRLLNPRVSVFQLSKTRNPGRDRNHLDSIDAHGVPGGLPREKVLAAQTGMFGIADGRISRSAFARGEFAGVRTGFSVRPTSVDPILVSTAESRVSQTRKKFSAWEEFIRSLSSENPLLLTITGLSLFLNLLLLLIVLALLLSGNLKNRFFAGL